MTEIRKSVLRTVRLDDDVWVAVKGMGCSLNQYLRNALLEPETAPRLTPSPPSEVERRIISEERDILSEASPFDSRPKNAYCKHCGSRFAGPRFATICPDCKSSGHTLTPAECPACNEARAL